MFNKNVDGILKGFNKTISQLIALEDKNNKKRDKNKDLADKMLTKANGHDNEAIRAKAIAKKIESLITPDFVAINDVGDPVKINEPSTFTELAVVTNNG